MTGALYIAWRYLAHHRLKTSILVLAIALIAFLPAGLNVLVGQSAHDLTARAEATPLLLGAKGSPLELVLSSLYFEARAPAAVSYAEAARVAETGLAEAIPLHVRFRAQGHPIVGTELGYFDLRGLRLAEGRLPATLGECVLGARAARLLGLGPGDSILSSPESVFDLAGVYPLRLHVAGVLAESHAPDDRAVFVDVRTAWVIAGLGHGHADLADPREGAAVISRKADESGERIVANASVRQYNEITPENEASFHFHGDLSSFPITAVIAVPHSAKAGTLLRGRYEAPEEPMQLLRPRRVIDDLLGTVFTVRAYVVVALSGVAAATLAVAALVFALSLRLRRREVETLIRIGGSKASVAVVLASEVVFVLVVSGLLALLLTLATASFGSSLLRSLLLT